MKTILMLTDFSENANHAAKSAAMFVEKLQTSILLYNAYYEHAIVPTYAGGPWVVEEMVIGKDESITQLNQLALQLRHAVNNLSKEGKKSEIEYRCEEGTFAFT